MNCPKCKFPMIHLLRKDGSTAYYCMHCDKVVHVGGSVTAKELDDLKAMRDASRIRE